MSELANHSAKKITKPKETKGSNVLVVYDGRRIEGVRSGQHTNDEPDDIHTDFVDILASDIMFTIDPVELAEAFHKCHLISDRCFGECLKLSDANVQRQKILRLVFADLSRPFSGTFWHILIGVLSENGYSFLAQRIERSIRKVYASDHVVSLSTNITRAFRGFYMDLRHLVEQGTFVSPRDQFATLAAKRKQLLYEARRCDPNRIRKMADKYAATLIIALDIPPADEDMEIFLQAPDKNMSRITNAVELERIASMTTNGLLTQFILYSRLILVYAFAGNNQMSETMVAKAKQLSYIIGASPELAEMYYFYVYYLLQRFEQDPKADIRNEIEANVLAGLDVLRVVESGPKSGNVDWQQFLLMKLISCLVGIGNHCTVIKNCIVTEECIVKARMYLARMDAIWEHVETRRRMLYYLTKGRLEDICGNNRMACHYIQKSISYAYEGHYVEVGIMEKYLSELVEMTISLPLTADITPYVSEIDEERNGLGEMQCGRDHHVGNGEARQTYEPTGDGIQEHMFEATGGFGARLEEQCAGGQIQPYHHLNGSESEKSSVKTYELFGDGMQHCESGEKELCIGRGDGHIPSEKEHDNANVSVIVPKADGLLKSGELVDDNDRIGVDDGSKIPQSQRERGDPDGMSNPD